VNSDFQVEVAPDVRELAALRRSLAEWLARAEVESSAREAVILATHEAAANAVEHAHAVVIVSGTCDCDGVTVVVTNTGPWKESEGSEFRGRGLPIMHGLMSHVDIGSDDAGSVVTMRLTL
jgi:anti-sigma regulatory factor (Ser/Thr protein kinase)